MSLTFETGTIPDTEPETDTDHMTDTDVSPEAPYGYKKDGTPYKRRPNGARASGGSTRTSGSSRVESKARQAAALLTQANELACFGVMAVGFGRTASALQVANEGFTETAYEALRQDEALCNTILKAGTTSAKITLLIAYGMLMVNVVPVAVTEYRDKRANAESESEGEYVDAA